MILEVDYGNTRIKWRFLDKNSLQCTVLGSAITLLELSEGLKDARCSTMSFVRVCSVRSAHDNAQLTALLEEVYGVAVVYAQSTDKLSGVTNGYIEPAKLGVDRWLAMIAAYSQIKDACVVIDCGTAITVDYIKADGVHLGGCIAPGVKLMDRMLQCGTHMPVSLEGFTDAEQIHLGRTTQQAIYSGVHAMVIGFIKEKLRIAENELGKNFVIIASGGDSELVSAVAADAVIQKDLVFTGLAIACPHFA